MGKGGSSPLRVANVALPKGTSLPQNVIKAFRHKSIVRGVSYCHMKLDVGPEIDSLLRNVPFNLKRAPLDSRHIGRRGSLCGEKRCLPLEALSDLSHVEKGPFRKIMD